MEPHIIKYLDEIKLEGAFRDRLEEFYEFYVNELNLNILDIFVTDFIEKNGARQYENLWLFDGNYMMESKLFLTKYNYDQMSIKGSINRWEINKTDYDFAIPTPQSRMTLSYQLLEMNAIGELKAAQENCQHLYRIFKTYILPNLVLNV